MKLDTTLRAHRDHILDDASAELAQLQLHHYETAGPEFTRARLESLYDLVQAAIVHRDVAAIIAYADAVAEERFAAGFDALRGGVIIDRWRPCIGAAFRQRREHGAGRNRNAGIDQNRVQGGQAQPFGQYLADAAHDPRLRIETHWNVGPGRTRGGD